MPLCNYAKEMSAIIFKESKAVMCYYYFKNTLNQSNYFLTSSTPLSGSIPLRQLAQSFQKPLKTYMDASKNREIIREYQENYQGNIRAKTFCM